MSKNYDNWERLVQSVLRREHDREIALRDSCSVSSASTDVTLSSNSSLAYGCCEQHPERLKMPLQMDYKDVKLDHSKWKAMLPENRLELVWRSAAPLRFFIDLRTRKNCFLLGATRKESESSDYWKRKYLKNSRFTEVAVVAYPLKLAISACIRSQILSPDTHYAAYLVFGFGDKKVLGYSENCIHAESCIYDSDGQVRRVIFQHGTDRGDGWMEIKLGAFYVHQPRKGRQKVEVQLHEISIKRHNDIFIEGIELRPDTLATGIFMKPR